MKGYKDKIILKVIFRPFKKEEKRKGDIGYYSDRVIEIDTTEPIQEIIDTCYHEFTHWLIRYFTFDSNLYQEINHKDLKFKKLTKKKEDRICKNVAKHAEERFTKYLGISKVSEKEDCLSKTK